jgi:hypothetical protein
MDFYSRNEKKVQQKLENFFCPFTSISLSEKQLKSLGRSRVSFGAQCFYDQQALDAKMSAVHRFGVLSTSSNVPQQQTPSRI